jgi:hypothetical protein
VLDDVKFIDFILDNSFAIFAMDDDICFNNFAINNNSKLYNPRAQYTKEKT